MFKTFRGVSDTLYGQVLHDQVAILKVRLSMLWREAHEELLDLISLYLALDWLYLVVCMLIFQAYLL